MCIQNYVLLFSYSVMSNPLWPPWIASRQTSLSFTISWSLLKLMSIESVMPPNHLIFYCLLLLLPSIFRSIKVFSSESALRITWPKYWSFSISPSNESVGLISFRIDWFDLLVVQGTLKSFLQHHNLKASVLQLSSSLWSNYHIHTWSLEKIIALTIWILLVKWCLHLLIHCLSLSYFQPKEQASSKFMAAVTVHSDFRAQENRICHCFHCFPI